MKSKKRKNNDKRVNIILVCIIIVLLALLIVVVATKTNKGQMKDKRPVPSRELYETITGKWYQKDKNEDVYINIRDINRALMHFDFKSGIEFADQQTSLVNGETTMDLVNGSDKINVNIKVFDDSVELTVLKSYSQYFTDGETYTFIIK